MAGTSPTMTFGEVVQYDQEPLWLASPRQGETWHAFVGRQSPSNRLTGHNRGYINETAAFLLLVVYVSLLNY